MMVIDLYFVLCQHARWIWGLSTTATTAPRFLTWLEYEWVKITNLCLNSFNSKYEVSFLFEFSCWWVVSPEDNSVLPAGLGPCICDVLPAGLGPSISDVLPAGLGSCLLDGLAMFCWSWLCAGNVSLLPVACVSRDGDWSWSGTKAIIIFFECWVDRISLILLSCVLSAINWLSEVFPVFSVCCDLVTGLLVTFLTSFIGSAKDDEIISPLSVLQAIGRKWGLFDVIPKVSGLVTGEIGWPSMIFCNYKS